MYNYNINETTQFQEFYSHAYGYVIGNNYITV